MTGYGAARATGKRVAVEVEARSVNARTLKTNVRSPALLAPHEAEVEALVRQHLRRGTVTVFIRLQFLQAADLIRVRTDIVEGFAREIARLKKKGLVEGPLTAEALATVPGALEAGAQEPLKPADWRVVRQAIGEALTALDAMRAREAVHLVRDLRAIAKRMRGSLAKVKRRAPQVVSEHARRLRERIAVLLQGSGVAPDEAALAREVALLADRSDITEEITRLGAHLDEFDRYLAGGGEVGRTLEFLAQEMLRETNTIGSKSQDVAIARSVIALKSDVDRLKEQVANLE